jgi:hypothetical protein
MQEQSAVKFTAEIANIKFIEDPLTVTVGDQTYTFMPDINKAYVHFDLLSSYPTVNANHVTFTLPVLARAFQTAINNPMDIEHILEGNPAHRLYDPETDKNRIVGAMLLSYVPGLEDLGAEIPLVPEKPLPMRVVAVIWKRTTDGAALIQSMAMGDRWSISMEVLRDRQQDMMVNPADNAFYKPDELPEDLVGKVALAVGGKGDAEDLFVNFWGGGYTLSAADKTAKIHTLVASTSKENMGALMAVADEPNITLTTNGKRSGTKLNVNGNAIDFKSLWMSIWDDSEDDKIHFEFTQAVDAGNGLIVNQRFELASEDDVTKIVEITKGETDMGTLEQIRKEIRESEFKDYVSPADLAAKIQAAEDKFKDYVSPADLQAKIDDGVQKGIAAKMQVFVTRSEQLKTAGLEMNDARSTKALSATDEEFMAFVAAEKASLSEMEKTLTDKKIAVGDQMKKEIAKFSGVNDPNFKAFVSAATLVASAASVSHTPPPVYTPGMGSADEPTEDEQRKRAMHL